MYGDKCHIYMAIYCYQLTEIWYNFLRTVLVYNEEFQASFDKHQCRMSLQEFYLGKCEQICHEKYQFQWEF